MEARLADAVKELQRNAVEMERNRVIPELVGLYNAENEAHKLLSNTEYTTRLIGTQNRRVITAFNPSNAIQWNAGQLTNEIDGDGEREHLDDPLHWSQDWTWDF